MFKVLEHLRGRGTLHLVLSGLAGQLELMLAGCHRETRAVIQPLMTMVVFSVFVGKLARAGGL